MCVRLAKIQTRTFKRLLNKFGKIEVLTKGTYIQYT